MFATMEQLEGRTLMDGSILLAGGVLRITGTARADRVEVTQAGGRVNVSIDDHHVAVFPRAAVRSIAFRGLDSSDIFLNDTDVRCVADGGRDDDILYGGKAGDVLYGGEGEGRDRLFGGGGVDGLFGGSGNDYLDGGIDNVVDLVMGQAGQDTLVHRLRDLLIQ